MNNPDYEEAVALAERIGKLDSKFTTQVRPEDCDKFNFYPVVSLENLRRKFFNLQLDQYLDGLEPQEAYKRLLEEDFGLSPEQWRNHKWLAFEARKSLEDGGIERNLLFIIEETKSRLSMTWSEFRKFMDKPEKSRRPSTSWTRIVHDCNEPEDFFALFRKHEIPLEKWKISSWLKQNGFSGLVIAVRRDKRFGGSWQIFLACIDGHLPFNGITSPTQAKDLLRQEILRLRTSSEWIQKPTKGNRITKVEWEEITKPEWYKKNPVVRAVADYLKTHEEG